MDSPTVNPQARTARLEEELERRRRTEEDLLQSQERLRVLVEHGGDIVYRLRLQPPRLDYVSPLVAEISGYEASEFIDEPGLVLDIVHADDRQLLTEYLESGDFSRPLALRVLRRDGEVLWLEHSAMPVHDTRGRLVCLEGIAREVTAYGSVLEELDHRYTSVEERERLMSALRRIGSATLGSLDLDHVVDTLAEQVVRTGILRSLMIALVDYEANSVRVVRNYLSFDGHYERGIGEVRPGAELVPSPTVSHREGERLIFSDQRIIGTAYALDDDNITPTVARTGTLTVIDGPDRRFDERFEHSDPGLREGTTSYFIPICRDGRVLAVMATGSDRSQKAETLRRIEAMQPLLEQAGIALDHALIHGRLRDNARELHDLNVRLRDEVSRRLRAEEALRDFSARNVQLAEDERRRVARELHDGVNQLLCGVGFGLESALRQIQPGSTAAALEQTRLLLDRTIQEVRRISQNLRPVVLDDLGLAAAVRSLCDEYSGRTHIQIEHDVGQIPEDLAPETAISLYRLLQEALDRSPQAPAGAVLRVVVRASAADLRAEVTVTPMAPPAGAWGEAIEHLRACAGLLGGSVVVAAEDGGAACLRIELPLPDAGEDGE